MKPIAVVTTHPIQYQAPLFRRLVACGTPAHVIFLSGGSSNEYTDSGFGRRIAWDVPLCEGFEHEFIGQEDRLIDRANKSPRVYARLAWSLRPGRFAAVLVHGYRRPEMLFAMAVARAQGLPVLYRSESNGLSRSRGIRSYPLGAALRRLASAFLSIGRLNDEFYARHRIPAERRFLAPYTVDNEFFRDAARTLGRVEARNSLSLPLDAKVILFVGKLVDWKQPDMLLRAFAKLNDKSIHLAFAGDGHSATSLRGMAQALAPGRVTFLGFLNQTELPRAYASADLFVLPSRDEPWGLVVNEAMNFGLPIVVSDRVGCFPDLVQAETTGWVFDHRSDDHLADVLARALADPDKLAIAGRNAASAIAAWNIDATVKGMQTAIEFVCDR